MFLFDICVKTSFVNVNILSVSLLSCGMVVVAVVVAFFSLAEDFGRRVDLLFPALFLVVLFF